MDQVLEYARQFTTPGKAAMAVGHIKRSCQSGAEVAIEQGLAIERELQAKLFASQDAKEGLTAFVEKRKPQFAGEVTMATTSSALPQTLTTRLFIGGEWVDAASGKTFEVTNPAKAETLAEVAAADAADVDRRSTRPGETFDLAWPGMPPRSARILWDMARLLEERKEEIARVETLQNGKPCSRAGSTST